MKHLVPLVLLVACGDIGLTATVGADGTVALLTLAPEGQVQFDSASPAGRSLSEEITFTSGGDLPIYVVDAWVETSTASVFYTAEDLPFPKTMEPGDELAITVRFMPAAAGTFHGVLVVETGLEGEIVARQLVGEGCSDGDGDGRC